VTLVVHVELRGTAGRDVAGSVDFFRTARATAIHVVLTGVKPGMHALHAHESDCGAGPTAADQTLDGDVREAGSRARRGGGDLGNVLADRDGRVDQWLRTDQLPGDAERGLAAKSIVLHMRGSDSISAKTGGIGEAAACGAVGAPKPAT
jgi:Cu-Zn family superoxide dismutase